MWYFGYTWGTPAYLCDVITRTLGAYAGGKSTEKISGTYHVVIWAMKPFVSNKFHVVPGLGTQADFFWGLWASIMAKRIRSEGPSRN